MIKIYNLKKKFNKEIIINDFSYIFTKGKYQITGNNGSGKTTLLKAMIGIDKNYEGKIIYSHHYRTDELLYNEVEYISQELNLLQNQTIYTNIKYINKLDMDKFKILLDENYIDITAKVCDLSGGQQQKVAFLIGICSLKNIVIFDEPFNNLDQESIKYFDKLIKMMDNEVIIIVNHESIKLETEFIKVDIEKYSKPINNLKIDNSPKTIKSDHIKKSNYITYLLIIKNRYCMLLLTLLIALLICSSYSRHIPTTELETYFTSNDIYYFESNEYIEELNPTYPISEYDAQKYATITSATIDINTLDLSKYPDPEIYACIQEKKNASESTIQIVKQPLLNPKNEMKLMNYYIYPSIVHLLYGEYPDDNTNEIIVDEIIALSISPSNIEKAIGQKITIDNEEYIITGIFESNEYNSATFYTSYTNSEETTTKGYFCYTDCESYAEYNPINNKYLIKNYFTSNKTTIFTKVIILLFFITVSYFLYYSYRRKIKTESKYMLYKGIKTYYSVDYIIISILILIQAIILTKS